MKKIVHRRLHSSTHMAPWFAEIRGPTPAKDQASKSTHRFPGGGFSISCGRPAKPADFHKLHLDGFRHFHEFRNLVEVHVAINLGGLGIDQLDLLHVFRCLLYTSPPGWVAAQSSPACWPRDAAPARGCAARPAPQPPRAPCRCAAGAVSRPNSVLRPKPAPRCREAATAAF